MKWTLLGFSAVLFIWTNVSAQIPDPDSEPGEEIQALVRNYLAEHPQVSMDDAITRIAVQTEILRAMEDLRQEFSSRLTDISIKQVPDEHILVQLKGPGPVERRTLKTESGSTRVVFEAGHARTKAEFYEVVNKHADLLYSEIPGMTGYMGRPGEDLLVIHVSGDEDQLQELRTTVDRLERVLTLSILLRPNMSRSLDMEYIDGGSASEQ